MEGILEDVQYLDNDLDDIIRDIIRHIKIDHPNDGEGGHIRIQRYRLVERQLWEHANYVWHIDGHHKLIRWHLVTHGGIDWLFLPNHFPQMFHQQHSAVSVLWSLPKRVS